MKYEGKFKMNKNFIGLIIPYVIVLLIPILIWVISNMCVIHNNEAKWISLLTNNIENNVRVIDSDIERVENMVDGISQNSAFTEFFSNEKLTYEQSARVKNILASYPAENGLIDDLYIYSTKSGLLINTDGIYYDAKDYYETHRPIEGYTVDEWKEGLNKSTFIGYGEQTEYAYNNKRGNVLPYKRNMPIYNPAKNDGNITTLINTDKLTSYFDLLLEKGSGELYVYNTQGRLLLKKGDKYLEEGKDFGKDSEGYEKVGTGNDKMYRFDVISSKNRWRYTVFINQKYVLSEVSGFNTLLNMTSILTFILGMLICFYFTYKKSEACLQVIKLLGINGTDFFSKKLKTNEFEILKPYLGQVLDENTALKDNVKKMGEAADYKALHMLFYGDIKNENAVLSMLKESNLNFEKKKFMVLVLRSKAVYNLEGEKNKKLFFIDTLEKYIKEKIYVYVADAKTMIALINFDGEEAEFYEHLRLNCAKMNTDVFFRYRMEVILGAGTVTNSVGELSESLKQAMRVISYKSLAGQNEVLFSEEIPDDKTMYYYPIELEDKIIKNVSRGNSEEATRILDIIYDENINKRSLSGERLEELIRAINSSLNRARQLYFADEEGVDYKTIGFTFKSFFEYAKDFIYASCESIKNINEGTQNEKFKNMIKYIDENYSDCDLSLNTLAETFDLNDITYISKQFKKITNENFFSYLERIRIEKACELLDGKHLVKEIAEQVGYVSDVSFRRAFKKRIGLSPREYIKK